MIIIDDEKIINKDKEILVNKLSEYCDKTLGPDDGVQKNVDAIKRYLDSKNGIEDLIKFVNDDDLKNDLKDYLKKFENKNHELIFCDIEKQNYDKEELLKGVTDYICYKKLDSDLKGYSFDISKKLKSKIENFYKKDFVNITEKICYLINQNKITIKSFDDMDEFDITNSIEKFDKRNKSL